MKIILSTYLFFSLAFVFSQEKREYEERISAEEFPPEAMMVVKTAEEDLGKTKYYKEVDGDKESYEAKFKFDGKRYSAEFSKIGELEDVEVKISKRELNTILLKTIKDYLDVTYDRWKIEKIQVQFLNEGSASQTLKQALSFEVSNSVNYELIVATKTKGKLQKFELLLNSEGKLLNKRNIVRQSYDFLIF